MLNRFLNANARKHEEEKGGDDDDVADCPDCDKHTLDDVFQPFRAVDRAQGAQHAQHTQNFNYRNGRTSCFSFYKNSSDILKYVKKKCLKMLKNVKKWFEKMF